MTIAPHSENDSVRYYKEPHADKDNIFDIWELGGSVGDSITPATRWPEYREWMLRHVRELLRNDPRSSILSLGCGNAFIEADLASQGYSLLAFDLCDAAVRLAQRKGVNALLQDINIWKPSPEEFDLAYCDGIFGHLYDQTSGFAPLLQKLHYALRPNGLVLISNDASQIDAPVQKHPTVPGFHWFSSSYLESQLASARFSHIESRTYVYQRPLSGARTRLVVTARRG